MMDFALSGHMTVDRDVVWWIGEHRLSQPAVEQRVMGCRIDRVGAQQAMRTEPP
jgi:hypothetical protein